MYWCNIPCCTSSSILNTPNQLLWVKRAPVIPVVSVRMNSEEPTKTREDKGAWVNWEYHEAVYCLLDHRLWELWCVDGQIFLAVSGHAALVDLRSTVCTLIHNVCGNKPNKQSVLAEPSVPFTRDRWGGCCSASFDTTCAQEAAPSHVFCKWTFQAFTLMSDVRPRHPHIKVNPGWRGRWENGFLLWMTCWL